MPGIVSELFFEQHHNHPAMQPAFLQQACARRRMVQGHPVSAVVLVVRTFIISCRPLSLPWAPFLKRLAWPGLLRVSVLGSVLRWRCMSVGSPCVLLAPVTSDGSDIQWFSAGQGHAAVGRREAVLGDAGHGVQATPLALDCIMLTGRGPCISGHARSTAFAEPRHMDLSRLCRCCVVSLVSLTLPESLCGAAGS